MGARDLPSTADAAAMVRAIWARHLRPAPRESVAAWADAHRVIVKGPERGPWRTSRAPYLREPMDCMSEGSGVQRVVMQFATQLGKTEVIYNTIFQRIHRSPQDMLFVQPTLGDAKDHSRERFAPTVRKMPVVAEQLPAATSRDESNSWQTKSLAGVATLFFAGANSARSLASKPLGLALCDEIDGYPADVDGEGDPLTLVWERLSNFHSRQLLLCSTPTIKGASRIEAEYLASDQRRYLVPCPHCGHRQVLLWGEGIDHGLQWLRTPTGDPRPDTVVHVCGQCGAAAQEAHKTAMLADGQWVRTKPEAPATVAGFHLSKLYSPAGWKSWADIVREWHKAKTAEAQGDDTRIKSWVNTTLAETYEQAGDKVQHSVLQQRAEDWPLRTVLPQMCLLTAGVDKQRDRLEASIWAWGRGDESQLVDRRVIYGDTSLDADAPGSPWAELDEYLAAPITHPCGAAMVVRATCVDSGDDTQTVYRYTRARAPRHILAIKGRKDLDRVLGRPTLQDVDYRGVQVKRGVRLWPVGTDHGKARLYARLRITAPGPGYVHLSRHMADEGFAQLVAERMVRDAATGRIKWVKRPGDRNEELDKAVYAQAAAHYVGIHTWQPADWAAAEARLRGKVAGATQDLFAPPVQADDEDAGQGGAGSAGDAEESADAAAPEAPAHPLVMPSHAPWRDEGATAPPGPAAGIQAAAEHAPAATWPAAATAAGQDPAPPADLVPSAAAAMHVPITVIAGRGSVRRPVAGQAAAEDPIARLRRLRGAARH